MAVLYSILGAAFFIAIAALIVSKFVRRKDESDSDWIDRQW